MIMRTTTKKCKSHYPISQTGPDRQASEEAERERETGRK